MYTETIYKKIHKCPLCNSDKKAFWYMSMAGGGDDHFREFNEEVPVVQCGNCGLFYTEYVLTDQAKNDFFEKYSSKVHEDSEEAVLQRQKMYELEFEYISQFMDFKNGIKVLDIGCAEGKFLDFFAEKGCMCHGIEIGKEAAEIAGRKYNIFQGRLPDLNISEWYNLIIMRGVIQYFEEPRDYFEKVDKLLNDNGLLYITSTPNTDSICHRLFKDKFTLPICAVAQNGFSTKVLCDYWKKKGYLLQGEKYFYEETPYANLYEDINKVQKALDYTKTGQRIDFNSPAFWGNMMTLVFSKQIR